MPIDAPIETSAPARSNGSASANSTARPIRAASVVSRSRGKNMVNSSPARRPISGAISGAPFRVGVASSCSDPGTAPSATARRRLATMPSSTSPQAWPIVSLTVLNRSRSMKNKAPPPSVSGLDAIAVSMRSHVRRKLVRLARPVTGSNIASRWTLSRLAFNRSNSPCIATASCGTFWAISTGMSPLRSPCAARVRRAMAASIAAAVAEMLRSAEAQHIAPQTTAGISARDTSPTLRPPPDVATRARMNANAPALIANTTARP